MSTVVWRNLVDVRVTLAVTTRLATRTRIVRVVDLGPWRLPVHPAGPVLWIPTDNMEADPTWTAFPDAPS